jgi:hypothetical protein
MSLATAVVLSDFGLDEFLSQRLQARVRTLPSTAMSRLQPTASAARIAASLRAINPVRFEITSG